MHRTIIILLLSMGLALLSFLFVKYDSAEIIELNQLRQLRLADSIRQPELVNPVAEVKEISQEPPPKYVEPEIINIDDQVEAVEHVAVETQPGVKLQSTALDIQVGFVPQAPYAVWDELHQEACEEAAMSMVVRYFRDQPITPHQVDQDILDLVAWQNERGYQVDATAQEISEILQGFYQYDSQVVDDPTIEDIKEQLKQGNLVIVPAAGRELKNHHFKTPGPIYHMLIIRGFNETEFITNDPGTRHGEGFRYPQQRLYGAIHDWNHDLAVGGMTDEEMAQGRKVMVVVEREGL